MSGKYKGKYRNESARLQNWDYRNDAAYFITICTKDREHYFGEIQNGKMQVSPVGAIEHVLWLEIKNHAKNIELGEFVMMPNHVHGVLILDGNEGMVVGGRDVGGMDGNGRGVDCRDVACNVPTNETTTVHTNETTNIKNERMAAISPKSNSISSIIRSYKSAVTKYCNQLELPFAWQSRFMITSSAMMNHFIEFQNTPITILPIGRMTNFIKTMYGCCMQHPHICIEKL